MHLFPPIFAFQTKYLYHRLWGIIYDGIFLYPKLKGVGKEYIKSILEGTPIDLKQGIENLKTKKKIHVITQEKDTCAVYGMPKSVDQAGLSNQQVALDKIAQEVILAVGVK